jgi:hypothetical protein
MSSWRQAEKIEVEVHYLVISALCVGVDFDTTVKVLREQWAAELRDRASQLERESTP